MSVPTGIDPLDEQLGGGVPPGSLVVIVLPTGGEYVPLLRAGLRCRSSVVLTSLKNGSLLADALDRSNHPVDASINELDPGKAPAVIPPELDRLNDATSLYVSTIGPVEKSVPTDTYIELLNTISERLTGLETTGYFLAYRGAGGSYNRTVTLDIADTIVEIEQVREPDRLCHRFVIPKATGVVLDGPDRTFEAAINPRSTDSR